MLTLYYPQVKPNWVAEGTVCSGNSLLRPTLEEEIAINKIEDQLVV